MTDEDIEKLAKAIAEKSDHGFYVDPKDHYSSHERLDRILDAYDSASNLVLKSLIGFFMVGVIAAVAMGLGWHK